MVIGGFQKLSLIDYPEKICAVVFTQGCNFRCSFCHNPDLISAKKESQVSEEKVIKYLTDHKDILDGVCITGGEPTLQADLPNFIAKIKKLGLVIKLDTNGSNPSLLDQLIKANLLDYIAMDIKNAWEYYPTITKTKDGLLMKNCQKSFRLIQASGIPHEFRTTVYPAVHTADNLLEISSYLKESEKYYLQKMTCEKNLEPNLKRVDLDLAAISKKIKSKYPQINISVR